VDTFSGLGLAVLGAAAALSMTGAGPAGWALFSVLLVFAGTLAVRAGRRRRRTQGRLILLAPHRRPAQLTAGGVPISSTPAARSSVRALSTVDADTPAVRSSSTVVRKPAATASSAVARTQ
jgi:hypothetical protein